MSETDFRTENRPSSEGLTDKLQQAGEDIKERASEAMNATTEAAREKLDEFGAAARATAHKAADRVNEQLTAQQQAGADFVMSFAENIRTAAKAFEQDTPIAARTIELAAGYVEDAADKLREKSMKEMFDDATTFARQHPAAFLGLSVLAGFAAVRFLKASGRSAARSQNYGAYDEFSESQYGSPGSYRSQASGGTARQNEAWRS